MIGKVTGSAGAIWRLLGARFRTMLDSDGEYLTIKAACELLGISPNTLRSWGATGKVTEYRHPLNNYRLFRRDELRKLKERLQNPEPVRISKEE